MRFVLKSASAAIDRGAALLPTSLLAALLLATTALAQTAAPPTQTAAPPAQSVTSAKATTAPIKTAVKPNAAKAGVIKPAGTPTRYLPNRFAGRAGMFYKSVWGVDLLAVKLTESGQIVRFTWRVLEPDKALALSNKEAQPSLVDPQAGVSLVVPSLENIGMMRQASTPESGKSYWMAFSNKGRLVKKGDRVNVVIGQFRANGLAVDE